VGTPEEVVSRRGLRAVEVEVDRASDAAALLRASPDVDEVAHYGNLLRVATRGGGDPVALVRGVLDAGGIPVAAVRETRITVEDAFVHMVREEAQAA
jgi:hypothetical protein